MKKTIGFLGAIALAAGAFSGSALADKHAMKKEYNVALDGTFAPHAMPKLSGGIEGFNVDLANEIGKRLGAKMNITAAQWSGLIPAMQAGKYDFLVAPTTITEERAKTMLFTDDKIGETTVQLHNATSGSQTDWLILTNDKEEIVGELLAYIEIKKDNTSKQIAQI